MGLMAGATDAAPAASDGGEAEPPDNPATELHVASTATDIEKGRDSAEAEGQEVAAEVEDPGGQRQWRMGVRGPLPGRL